MDYLAGIKKSIDYIENNLQTSISLDELASQAFCSRFHYHRIFKAVMGETIMEFVRKKRLKKASSLLLKTDKCIKDIALECGFDFQQSFTRAFKKVYRISPIEYRKNKRTFIRCEKLDFNKRKPFIEKPITLSEPVYGTENSFKFVGMKCLTTVSEYYENGIISKLWDKFIYSIAEIKNRADSNTIFGIGFDNYSEKLGYIACVKVEKIECIPIGMEVKTISSSKYAIFTHKGISVDIMDSLDFILGKWLTDSGYELSSEIEFIIRMDERFTCEDNSELDIYIPIK